MNTKKHTTKQLTLQPSTQEIHTIYLFQADSLRAAQQCVWRIVDVIQSDFSTHKQLVEDAYEQKKPFCHRLHKHSPFAKQQSFS